MKIVSATEADYEYLRNRDHHVLESLILAKIKAHEIYILRDLENRNIGWLRYGHFWDNTPFLNLIWIDEPYRRRGIGKRAVLSWEDAMKQKGFQRVMTSTLANEDAQHFYRNLGYRDAGCLLLESGPMEIIFIKSLR